MPKNLSKTNTESISLNNLLTLVITLIIGIVLTVSVISPVISDTTETEHTFINTGVYRMTDEGAAYSLTYDPINHKFIINNKDYPFESFPEGRWTIVSTDAFMFRFQAIEDEKFALYVCDTTSNSLIASTDLTDLRTWTFDDGVYTGYDGVSTRTYTAESFRGYDPKGNFVMTDGTHIPVVKGDSSIIIGHGLTQVGATNAPFYIVGTVNDGVEISTKSTITVSDESVNTIKSDKYLDCYKLNDITFKATLSSTTVDATYNRIIVPWEVTVEVIEPLDAGSSAVLNAIPIIVIVALVVMATGALYIKRDD